MIKREFIAETSSKIIAGHVAGFGFANLQTIYEFSVMYAVKLADELEKQNTQPWEKHDAQ